MPTRSNRLALALAPACVCGIPCVVLVLSTHAQPAAYTSDPRQTTTFRRVDQGYGDQTPLSASARAVPIDLREPAGFDQLFQLTGPGGRLETRGVASLMGGTNGLFFRFSGGLAASFPRSVYAESPAGLQPLIPPGTVFSIGQKPAWGPGQHVSNHSPRANAIVGQPRTLGPGVSLSARAPSTGAPASAPRRISDAVRGTSRETREMESLWTAEVVRRRVIERLLRISEPDAPGRSSP